jgi:glutaconate CoA-transferase subunit B
MSADSSSYTLAELVIAAASETWRGDGEILASGIGVVPRLAVSLAKLTHSPELMMTDAEAFLVEDPLPLGESGHARPSFSGWMTYDRVFLCLWNGRRHAMVGPTQIDRWGQANISCLGDFAKPKVQMLGVRGFPGNSISHPNSMFVPNHGKRVFVPGEVDVVSSVGYNARRFAPGVKRDFIKLRRIVTNLCIMDFGGPDHAIRLISLHPGVTFEQVQEATGFPLHRDGSVPITPAPTEEQLRIIRRLDPKDMRAGVIAGNPAVARS